MLILTIDHTQKVWSEVWTGRVVSFLDPLMKNNTASILKSTRVGTIPLKQNYRCACPINYPSAYSGKHINSPYGLATTLLVYKDTPESSAGLSRQQLPRYNIRRLLQKCICWSWFDD